jgi:hypothetical protein
MTLAIALGEQKAPPPFTDGYRRETVRTVATIRVQGDDLLIDMHGMDVVWALRSQLTISLRHITNVEARPKDAEIYEMVRRRAVRVGSYIPGYVTAGYFFMSKPGAIAPNAAAVFDSLAQAKDAIEAWPQGSSTPRQTSHRDAALDHLGRATDAMRAAADELGVDTSETGRGWAFYEVHDPEKTIGFDVSGEKIRRVIIQIDGMTPDEAVKLIQDASKS